MKRGVTLLEVLFAIVVASVGLLAVLATLTLASSNIQKAETARLSGTAGESAIAAFQVEGMQRPARWIFWNQAAIAPAFVPSDFQQATSPFYGYAFCIDPMGWAHNRTEDAQAGTDNSVRWGHFPAIDPAEMPNAGRMIRLTLHSGAPDPKFPTQWMNYLQADKVFRAEDQLIYERPDNNAVPAVQLFTTLQTSAGPPPTFVPGRRQEEGRLTWFATLSPSLNPGVSLSGGQPVVTVTDEYVLAIVVCRNRGGESLHVPGSGGPEPHPWPEWSASIQAGDMHALGYGGGEVTITERPVFSQPLDLRSGSWIALARTVQTRFGRVQHFRWYCVSDADETSSGQQAATLVGGDWPADLDGNGSSEECDVVIVPEALHVLERTVRLER
jgi:prepilin-type N-terminal cleavage/methylation domain-containing protein